MPVRIEFGPQGSDLHSWKMCDFFQSQSAFELLEAPSIAQLTLERLALQEALQGCCTPKFQPKAEPFMFEFNSPSKSTTMNEFNSPSKSTTTASDIHHRYNSPATSTTTASDDVHNSADRDFNEPKLSFKEYEEIFAAEDLDESPCYIPFLDPLDWDGVPDADRRLFVASELVELLGKYNGQLLLSKVGSVLTDETRLALRDMRIRLLTFLKETPQKKYFRIEGAGGGQVLILRDLRDLRGHAESEESHSLDAVRAELYKILAPCRRRNALLLRSLGSSLSHAAKVTLKANRLSLSQFLALDKSFVLRKSHVHLAEADVGLLLRRKGAWKDSKIN
jgi:hypothetical protein